jgi:glycosyltransferase involved in cell wall biosynthesis
LKTVLVYTDSHDRCGVGNCNAALVEGLHNAGYRVVYAKRQEVSPLQQRLKNLGVEFCWLDYSPDVDPNRFANDRAMPSRIFSEIKPDLVFFGKGQPSILFGGIEAARALSIPYIIWEGSVSKQLLPDTSQPDFIQALRLQYEHAEAVICLSQENLDVLCETLHLAPEIGTIVPAPADARFFTPVNPETRNRIRQAWGIPDDGIVCFTSAQLEAIKGHGVQVYAMHLLKSRPEWERLYFVWAGEGSQRQRITKALEKVGVTNKVKLLGQVWNVDELMDAADIFILTSVSEGMGRVFPEAMAKGLPIIATKVGGIPEAVGEHAILLSPPTDVAATASQLADAIAAWVQDEEGRKKFGEAGRMHRSMQFFEPRIVEQYLEIVDRAIR